MYPFSHGVAPRQRLLCFAAKIVVQRIQCGSEAIVGSDAQYRPYDMLAEPTAYDHNYAGPYSTLRLEAGATTSSADPQLKATILQPSIDR